MHPLAADPINRRLLDEHQRGFPLAGRPFARIGAGLGLSEDEVLARFAALQAAGLIGRIGAVVAPHRAGWSTLAAMAVPAATLAAVAALVGSYPGVNHNYEREHALNLWFVATGRDRAEVQALLADIARRTGLEVLDLPLEEAFHIDLGFPLRWT